MILALTLAIAIGVALGLLGGGGAIVTVPVLVYAAKVSPQVAVAMALAIVGITSAVGAAIKWKDGLVHGRAALLFGTTGTVGALIGAQLTRQVSPTTLMVIFAILMIAVAMAMLLKKRSEDVPQASQCQPWRCASAGGGVGLLTGFLGVGGGFLIVPALILFGKVPLKKAIGTSLVIIAINSVAGLIGHLGEGSINWKMTGLFAGVALLGMIWGIKLTPIVPKESLNRWFAWFVIIVAIYMLSKSLFTATNL